MTERIPAEVFAPGEILSDELEARGWNQADFASIIDSSARLVSEVISGKRAITPETATKIGRALGTGPQIWLNLESAYKLFQLRQEASEANDIELRAKLFEKAPVREMVRRGWIEPSDSATVLKQRVLEFLGITSLDESPSIWAHAARKSTDYDSVTPAQLAWLCRARRLAKAVDCQKYTKTRFKKALEELSTFRLSPEELRRVPGVLAEAGIRLVVVEHLTGTKIDGACFWLDGRSPVVALSLRFDRIDGVWHSLVHELGHVAHGDGLNDNCPIDSDLFVRGCGDTRPDYEVEADRFATEFLVDQDELQDFIARTAPLYSRKAIQNFSRRIGVHPGLVVGQLQYREEVPWSHFRNSLTKVRSVLTSSALTDGWGHTVPTI